MIKIMFVLTAFIFLINLPGFGLEPLLDDNGIPFTEKVVGENNFRILGFVAGGTHDISEVIKSMGRVDVYSSDDDVVQEICYYSPKDNTVIKFVFYFGTLIAFKLMVKETEHANLVKCSKCDIISKNVATNSDLKLGITKKQLKNILGNPAAEKNEKLIYRNVWKIKKADPIVNSLNLDETIESWFVITTIDALFVKSRLVCLEVSRGIEAY